MTFFVVCAAAGGTIMVLQLLLSLIGLGGDHDIDVHDGHVDFGGHSIDMGDHDFGDYHLAGDHADHGSSAFFGVLSFRSLVAAVTFFGLGGTAALASDLPVSLSVAIGCGCGAGAMVLVGWLMRLLHTLGEEGNVQIERAVGQTATVYLSVPGKRKGAGKVTVKLQNRTMEYQAITSNAKELPTGAHVVVVGVASPDTLEVAEASD